MIRLILSSITLMLLCGCGSSHNTLPYSMTITSDGVGSLHPGAPFDVSFIQSTLPGFTLEPMAQVTPDKAENILILKRNGLTIAYIVSDKKGKQIEQITVLSSLIKDNRGQGIGDPLQPMPTLICDDMVCRYTDDPALSYVLASSDRTIREITVQKL